MSAVPVLVCFPVREEARFFSSPRGRALITGIGRANTERALTAALDAAPPSLVLSCGFGGGLNPDLSAGTVIFDAAEIPGMPDRLLAAGARPVRFHSVDRVITTVGEKQNLRASTGADVVEMESSHVRSLCRSRGIPSATLRVISDPADQDLPLDFNQLMTLDMQLSYVRLMRALVLAPGRIPALLRLQKQTELAARNLARVLDEVLADRPAPAP